MRRLHPLVGLLVVISASARAEACSCPETPSVAMALSEARSVVLVKVLSSEAISEKGVRTDPRLVGGERARVRVLIAWKGSRLPGDNVFLETPRAGAGSCGRNTTNDPVWVRVEEDTPENAVESKASSQNHVVLPNRWLIYANGDSPWSLSMCSRTGPADGLADDIKVLDRLTGRKPPRKRGRN